MELDKLIIEISADDAKFVQSLGTIKNGLLDFGATGSATADQVAKALKAVEKAIFSTNDAVKKQELITVYNKLNAELIKTKKEFKELTKIIIDIPDGGNKVPKLNNGLNDLDQSARRARVALYGMNQIVRDLPFGFIAISNNIPVALDQFQALVQETGSTGKAIKSLGGALVGAGGLSIAFSVVSSALVGLVQEYGSLANAINNVFNLIDAEAQARLKLKDATAESSAATLGDVSNIRLLVSTMLDFKAGNNERINSYNELKRIAPGVIQDLSTENIFLGKSTELIRGRSEELIRYIQLKGRESALIKLVSEETEKGLKATQNLLRQVTGEGRTWVDVLSDATQAAIFQNPIAALKSTSKEVVNASKQTLVWSNSLEGVRKQILALDGLTTGQISFKDLSKNQGKALTKTEKELNKQRIVNNKAAQQAEIEQLKQYLQTLNNLTKDYEQTQIDIVEKEYALKANILATQVEDKKELDAALIQLEKALQFEITKIVADGVTTRVASYKLQAEEAKKANAEASKGLDSIPTAVPKSFQTLSQSIIDRVLKAADKSRKDVTDREQERIDSLLKLSNQYADSIANATGAFVQGLIDGKKPLELLAQGFKRLAVEIAVALARAIAFEAITKALDIAAPGAGTALKSGAGIFDALFARGAAAPSINPSVGLNFGQGGLQLAGQVVFTQRGSDLVAVLNSSNARINRVG